MSYEELPANALLFYASPQHECCGVSNEFRWNGRLDLNVDEALRLSLSEFKQYYSALKMTLYPTQEKIRMMNAVQRRIANREHARVSRERIAHEKWAQEREIESLKARIDFLENILELRDAGTK